MKLKNKMKIYYQKMKNYKIKFKLQNNNKRLSKKIAYKKKLKLQN